MYIYIYIYITYDQDHTGTKYGKGIGKGSNEKKLTSTAAPKGEAWSKDPCEAGQDGENAGDEEIACPHQRQIHEVYERLCKEGMPAVA